MEYKITMAEVCELAHTLTIQLMGESAEKITKRGGEVTVAYTKKGQEVFDRYYKLITETLGV